MEELSIYLVKSGICLGIFLLVYCLFLRRTTFFRFNRLYLMTGLLASFLLPLYQYTYEVPVSLPVSFFQAETVESVETFELSEPVAVEAPAGVEMKTVLLCIYALGILILLRRHLSAYRKLRRLLRDGKKTCMDDYCIVDNPAVKSPFSVFNYIFINSSNLSAVEKESILKHELTHITQRHRIDLLCSQLILMTLWFNPLMWLYIRCQKENHEFLADEAVLVQGVSPAMYQAVLINQKFQAKVFAFGNPFNYSKPFNRLKMMKKAKTRPWQKAVILFLIPAFGAFFHAFAETRYVVEYPENQEEMLDETAVADSTTASDVHVFIAGSDTLNDVLVLLDGKEISRSQMQEIDFDSISSFLVLKDSVAIKAYGKSAKQGVIEIKTKRNDAKERYKYARNRLILIDGKESTYEELVALEESKPEYLDINANYVPDLNKYGEKAKNGVITVSTKRKDDFFASGKVEVNTIRGERNKEITVKTGGGTVTGTFDKDEEPLVIVDGKEMTMQEFQSLNADDIATIGVYKDMAVLDSAAIIKKYGKVSSKFRVIKATTKNKNTAPKKNYNNQRGAITLKKSLDFVQYLEKKLYEEKNIPEADRKRVQAMVDDFRKQYEGKTINSHEEEEAVNDAVKEISHSVMQCIGKAQGGYAGGVRMEGILEDSDVQRIPKTGEESVLMLLKYSVKEGAKVIINGREYRASANGIKKDAMSYASGRSILHKLEIENDVSQGDFLVLIDGKESSFDKVNPATMEITVICGDGGLAVSEYGKKYGNDKVKRGVIEFVTKE